MKTGMEELERKSQECIAKADPALKRAGEIATALKLSGIAREMEEIRKELGRDKFTVVIFGRFKTGKSTFLNALLGKSPFPNITRRPYKGLMPEDVNPCTVRPTKIKHAENPRLVPIYSFRATGEREQEWTFERFHREARQQGSESETNLLMEGIDGFEMEYPTPFCRGGVEIIDTPGTDDNEAMDLQTYTAAQDADAAVFVLTHPGTAGRKEIEYLDHLKENGLTSFLTIINARDPQPPHVMAMPPSEETIKVIWNRLLPRLRNRGQYIEGARLEQEDIFYMNALQAFNGRIEQNEEEVRRSGILAFEERLAAYLQDEPRFVHLKRFLDRAEPAITSIEKAIDKEARGLEQEQQGFQAVLDGLLPKLAEVPKRAARVPKTIKHACTQAQKAVLASLKQAYAQIEEDLPAYMQEHPLPCMHKEKYLENLWSIAKARVNPDKTAVKEAQEIALDYIKAEMRRWRTAPPDQQGAQQAMQPHLDAMMEELRQDAAAIERDFANIQFELTGWTAPDAQSRVEGASLANRVTAAVFGVLTLQPDYTAMGAVGGWNAIGRGMLGRIAVIAPLMFVFHASLPVTLPLAIVGGIFWSVAGGVEKLENNIKKTVVEKLLRGYPADEQRGIPAFGGLANEPQRMQDLIDDSVKKLYDDIEASVMKVVNGQIQDEQQSLLNQQENAQLNAADRAAKLSVLKGYTAEIRKARNELKQALTSAAQTKSRV
jgi:Dynamin family